MRRRYREPVLAAFLAALIASLAVHLPVYEVLGNLADHLRELAEEERKKHALNEVEVDFEIPEDMKSELAKPKKLPNAKPPPRRKPKPREVVQAAEQSKKQTAPPQERLSRQAVQQRSQNPDVEPPPNAQYVAQENNRVEEETVARVRNYIRDDAETSVGRQEELSSATEEEGNAQKQEIADARDKEGSDARKPTEEEASRDRPDDAIDADPIQAERVARTSPDGRSSEASGEPSSAPDESETITISDESGTFTISKPSRSGKRAGRRAKGKGPGGKITWSQFEAAVGADQLREDRRARIQERKSKQRGVSRNRSWKQFRAAIENFTPAVKPGAQTALNAAASPFANYITGVHRRIHREFADTFLANLPVFSGSPYSDPTLMTKLEIILNRDGSVHRVGVARSSGLLPFDFGAFNSVLRAQPYPQAPSSILSGDGRVYLHWGFYRNHRQCGTFNAEPYILPRPPGSPARRGLTDGPEWDTVVPSGAQPTWRTRDEPDNSGSGDPSPKKRNDSRPGPKKQPPPAQPKEEDGPAAPPPPPGSALG